MLTTLYEGMKQACDAYDMTIIGGDTTAAHQLVLSVSVVGAADEEEIVYRGGAQEGDAICVTGDLGASFAGLQVLIQQRRQLQEQGDDFEPDLDRFSYVVRRHLAPPAQLKAVRSWRDLGVKPHALIDVSDGLASEIHHICEASDVGAQLFGPALPIAVETRNTASAFGEDVDVYALFGGEDYELLFTIPEDQLDPLDPQTFSVIGTVRPADEGVQIQQPDGENVPLEPGGFDHFRGEGDAEGEEDGDR
jgi:thiamine-monophosphate kinase